MQNVKQLRFQLRNKASKELVHTKLHYLSIDKIRNNISTVLDFLYSLSCSDALSLAAIVGCCSDEDSEETGTKEYAAASQSLSWSRVQGTSDSDSAQILTRQIR